MFIIIVLLLLYHNNNNNNNNNENDNNDDNNNDSDNSPCYVGKYIFTLRQFDLGSRPDDVIDYCKSEPQFIARGISPP